MKIIIIAIALFIQLVVNTYGWKLTSHTVGFVLDENLVEIQGEIFEVDQDLTELIDKWVQISVIIEENELKRLIVSPIK